MKTIYTLIIINENMEICGAVSFNDKQSAIKELNEDYERTIKMLASEGWEEDDLSVNELEPEFYYVQYGESSYYAEIKDNTLLD